MHAQEVDFGNKKYVICDCYCASIVVEQTIYVFSVTTFSGNVDVYILLYFATTEHKKHDRSPLK